MKSTADIKAQVWAAFEAVEFPGDWCLRDSSEGEEPFLLEREFAGKTDRQALDPSFLDHAPDGYASALSFFSDEAFRFYLPAYLVADLDGKLDCTDPVFHLTYGLDEAAHQEPLNPRRYGARTKHESAVHRLSVFSREQASAIVAYLTYLAERDEHRRENILYAIHTYWQHRAA